MKAKKFIKFIMIGLISLSVLSTCSGCKGKESEENPKVQVEMESGGKFIIELYPQYAPKTVENFVKLVKEGFYDGLTFHRIIDGFMAQGGDPEGTGMGGSSQTIKGEFSSNGYKNNTLSHTKGVISMARGNGLPDSASSQFFIVLDEGNTWLDGDYAAFGKVIEGMNVVEDFQKIERTMNGERSPSKPVTPVVMKKVTMVE